MGLKDIWVLALFALVAGCESLSDPKDSAIPWDTDLQQSLGPAFRVVNSSSFSSVRDTVVAMRPDGKAPLVVSLHTWSGDYRQKDPLASAIIERGWNYIRPNFQGPNNNPDACLSSKVIQDLDAAITWALEQGVVDEQRIIVLGVSGGGYTALGYQPQSKHRIHHTFAWVPITDLERWYWESRNRGNKYAGDVLGCVDGELSSDDLLARSPIGHPPNPDSAITIYTGLHDGYSGSVPISHSLRYFNRFADESVKFTPGEMLDLISKAAEPTELTIVSRAVYAERLSGKLQLIVFDGGHEMLEDAALEAISASLESASAIATEALEAYP
jgi:hypothetical protein